MTNQNDKSGFILPSLLVTVLLIGSLSLVSQQIAQNSQRQMSLTKQFIHEFTFAEARLIHIMQQMRSNSLKQPSKTRVAQELLNPLEKSSQIISVRFKIRKGNSLDIISWDLLE